MTMIYGNIWKIILAIIAGEIVLALGTTIAQEVLFDGIGLSSPLPELLIGGFATFIAAVLAGLVARIIIKKPVKIVAIVISTFIIVETCYLIIADKTIDPVWFDLIAGLSLIIGVWIGFYVPNLITSQQTLLFLFCGVPSVNAHAQTYEVTVSNEPFIFLEDPQIAMAGPWDEPNFQVPLGFDFTFFDLSSDQLYCKENSFGGYTSMNTDEEDLYMLLHFYALLTDRGAQQDSALSPIQYKTEGMVGERVFTLEFNNAGLFHGLEDDNGIFLDYINIQVRLYEASGDIAFHIGPYSILEDPEDVFDGFLGPIIGLMANVDNSFGGSFGEAIILSGDPLNPTVVSDPFNFVSWPIPENTVYRFSRMSSTVDGKISVSSSALFYPNPVSGRVHLHPQITDQVYFPIVLLDARGRQQKLWSSPAEMSVSNLPAGCYFAVAATKSGVVTERIVVVAEGEF